MELSVTGAGLTALILCDYVTHHNWMAYLCWYSLTKNLPDAQIVVLCNRNLMTHRLFDWCRLCKVNFRLHKICDQDQRIALAISLGVTTPILALQPDVIAARSLADGNISLDFLQNTPKAVSPKVTLVNDLSAVAVDFPDACCEAKEEKITTFVSYSEGWGKFVTSSWINKVSCPFSPENRYAHGSLTVNELKLAKLWSASAPLYQTIVRAT